MKKFAVMMVALMLAILAIVPVSFASAENTKTVYVASANGNRLNLRNEANADARVLAQLGNGKPLTVIADVNATWLKVSVKLDGKVVKGYVNKNFVSDTDPSLMPQTFTKVDRFKVTVVPSNGEAGFVNLRAKASTSSTVLAYLHKGDVLTVVAESNAYYQVRTMNGLSGYVVKSCVNK